VSGTLAPAHAYYGGPCCFHPLLMSLCSGRFFTANTQDKYQKRVEYFVLVGADQQNIATDVGTQGIGMVNGRRTLLPS